MVFIPQGSFYAGDYNTSAASLNSGSADSNPWNISSENPVPVTNATSAGYQYVSGGNAGEYATGASFTIPAAFPKGYNAFYAMKYAITEGQWVQFVNSLPTAARVNHNLSDTNHKNSTNVTFRNTISCAGSPVVCSTLRPARAVSYLSWMDLAAFLDWAALRPMTELEFEKMSRGPLVSKAGEYVWGDQTINPAATISGTNEDGTETITDAGANANYGNTTFTGGDSALGAGYNQGPLRTGIFAGSNTNRTASGASYYGVMDLAGDLKEHVVTVGNSTGLAFTGSEGNGSLSTAAGFEGYALNADWPGIDAQPQNGVDSAAGTGFRGGSWADAATYLRTSDRTEAALASTAALNTFGGRGVRTYDGP
jgi:formylglycine-generating enzyme required for sulfatase activity